MDLLIIFAIVWFVKNAVVEAKYAALGKTPPRHQIKLARLAAAGKASKSTTPPRYGSRDYFADLWGDALQTSTEKRRAKSAKRDAAAKEAELDAATDEAIAVATPEPPRRPTAKPPVCVRCGATGSPAGYYSAPGEPTHCVPCGDLLAPAPAPSGPDAQVIPLIRPKKEVPVMSATTEVSGLVTAINFAQTMAESHTENVTKIESFKAFLRTKGVTGFAVEEADRAMEKENSQAASWSAIAAELQSHTAVAEAYRAHDGAGDKDLLLSE